jgi:hypothetical protein
MKLADDVHDTHFNLPTFTDPKEGELLNPHLAAHDLLDARPPSYPR